MSWARLTNPPMTQPLSVFGCVVKAKYVDTGRLTFLTPLHQTIPCRIASLLIARAWLKGEPARRLTWCKELPLNLGEWVNLGEFFASLSRPKSKTKLQVWISPELQTTLDVSSRPTKFTSVDTQVAQALFMNHTSNTIWHRIIRVCMEFS